MTTTHIIIDGIVANTIIASVSEAQAAYPEALCIDAEQHPGGIGWVWDGDELTPPPAPPQPIEEMRAQALARINAEYEARTAALAEGYPASERESWPVQIAESAIVRGDDDQPTPWIDQAAPARGISRLELANLIHGQDLAYRQYHGTLTGIRQALRDDISAVPDDENAQSALDAIVWPPDPEPEPEL